MHFTGSFTLIQKVRVFIFGFKDRSLIVLINVVVISCVSYSRMIFVWSSNTLNQCSTRSSTMAKWSRCRVYCYIISVLYGNKICQFLMHESIGTLIKSNYNIAERLCS